MIEYGNAIAGKDGCADTTVMINQKGFQMVGQGFRIDLPTYGHLIC